MFSYNDSMVILADKIASPLGAMVAREGLQVTKSELQSPKIVEKIAILCTENKEFTLSVFENDGFTPVCCIERWGDNSSFERIRINFSEGVNPIDSSPQIIKYHSDKYFNIPSGLPKFLHKFVSAVVMEWL
jgi:hypothetical protein